jgi:DNA-directed RNA polymerase subunit RPC12/RpoP
MDEACYPCACGNFFIAPVSTSVTCPYCGARQAW